MRKFFLGLAVLSMTTMFAGCLTTEEAVEEEAAPVEEEVVVVEPEVTVEVEVPAETPAEEVPAE